MDSGNSGSMQSSSTCGGGGGGDEEYDSRAESISAFFNSNNLTSHVGPMPNPPPSSSTSCASSACVYQDTLFTNFCDHPSLAKSPQSFNTNTNSFGNLDMVWSKNVLSDLNCTDLGNPVVAPSSTQQQQQQPFRGTTFQAGQESVQRASVSALSDQNNSGSRNNVGRNPKKRSRASRRAPTTVLTTDTNNFRAMVQEFTGIPAPPFTSTSFVKSRLDLFGTASSALRSVSGHLDVSQSSPNLLRPFAQKVQQPYIPFVGSSSSTSSSSLFGSSMVGAIASTTVTTTAASNNNNDQSTSNTNSQLGYQMPSDLGLLKQLQSQNIFNINMQNPALNFQPFLQGPPRYPLSNTAILESKQPQGTASLGMQSADNSQLKMGTLEDQFGTSSHGQVHNNIGGLQNIVSSGGWPGDRGLSRSINGSYITGTSNQGGNVSNNGNYGATSSDVRGDKGPENVAPRSEGMVESWICSSD